MDGKLPSKWVTVATRTPCPYGHGILSRIIAIESISESMHRSKAASFFTSKVEPKVMQECTHHLHGTHGPFSYPVLIGFDTESPHCQGTDRSCLRVDNSMRSHDFLDGSDTSGEGRHQLKYMENLYTIIWCKVLAISGGEVARQISEPSTVFFNEV